MNRAELQQLTRDRLRDAKALLAARRWSGAYYLSGYAVECALKSCIIVYLTALSAKVLQLYSQAEQLFGQLAEPLFVWPPA